MDDNNEDDLENLECLDLNNIIEENKSNDLTEKISHSDKKSEESTNSPEEKNSPLFQLTRSFNKGLTNLLKQSEEVNNILTNNFTLNHPNNTKEKEQITELLKSTINKSQKSHNFENSESLFNTMNINEEKKEFQEFHIQPFSEI